MSCQRDTSSSDDCAAWIFSIVDEKEEVPVSFFVEVENQARHDEGFAAAGRHIEQEMEGRFFAFEIVFKTEEEPGKSFHLIGAEFKRRVQVVTKIIGDFGILDGSSSKILKNHFEQKLCRHHISLCIR